ncbi:unnamed protein product, partial [Trichobilharzia szidati]
MYNIKVYLHVHCYQKFENETDNKMSSKIARSDILKTSSFGLRPGGFLHFFIWMMIDTFLMLLMTVGMLVMVNKINGLCNWITENKWISILLILLAALPMFILALLKILKIRRDVDHFLIGFSFLLCSMGFATMYRGFNIFNASISFGVTIALTTFVIVLALYLRNSSTALTITLFAFMCVLVITGVIVYVVQIIQHVPQRIYTNTIAVSFGIAVALAMFLTMNRLRFC